MLNDGVFKALLAYLAWGLFPLYWKQLQHVPAMEVLVHRILWALVFLAIYLSFRSGWAWLRPALRNWRLLGLYAIAAVLISINWGVYIYAVSNGHIVETSLGYYTNPLLSVLLGMVFFKERLRPLQAVAILLAAVGVGYMIVMHGRIPVIAIALAMSFALYGVVKKLVSLGAFEGMTLETGILFLPALLMLLYWEFNGNSLFGHQDRLTDTLLIFGGVLTVIPLLLFAAAAEKISLTLIGMIQYIAPSLQILLGVFIYGEPFGPERQIGFAFIWLALLLFSGEGLWRNRRALKQQ
jgi:chloramphenicol-sensitive protein RarD